MGALDPPGRAPSHLPWSPVTVWWLFFDAPTPWFAAFAGLWGLFAVAAAVKGLWDVALLWAAVVGLLFGVRVVRARRRRR
jgi:hypothetical protein